MRFISEVGYTVKLGEEEAHLTAGHTDMPSGLPARITPSTSRTWGAWLAKAEQTGPGGTDLSTPVRIGSS